MATIIAPGMLHPERMQLEWRREPLPDQQLEGDPTGWYGRPLKVSEYGWQQMAEQFLQQNPDRYFYVPGMNGRVRICYTEFYKTF